MAKVEVKVVSDCGLDGLTFHFPSRTKPQFASDCDLSTIVRRFLKTGELPQLHHKTEIADATGASDNLFDALEPAVKARQAFDQLPLEERNKYNNDVEAWIADKLQDKPDEPKPDEPKPDESKPDEPKPDEPKA